MNEFEFPLETEYHPSGLVMDEYSVEREGWLGTQTMNRPQTLYNFSGNYPNPVYGLMFRYHATNTIRPSIVGNDGNNGWWHHNATLFASNRPYKYVRVEQVHTFELEGRTGDYTVVRRVFIALRDDGRLDYILDTNPPVYFGLEQPAPPSLQDNHTYSNQQLVEWEEAFLVAVAVPKAPTPRLIRSKASEMVRILRNPNNNTTLNITLTHPNAATVDFFVYVFVGGQAFFVGSYTSPFTQITIPPNSTLFLKGVNFRFFADNQAMFTANGEKLTGMLSLGNRMVYWGQRGVYISSKNFAFMFGTEEGYTPQEGDGAFVSLPNVLWCAEVGSTIIAFTQKKTFRIVEAGQGIWVAIETDYITPLLENGQPLYRDHIYKTSIGYVDVSSGEEDFFGMRFRLLSLKQITGIKSLGLGIDANKDIWVWNEESIYQMPNETADLVFSDAGKFILVRGTSSNLTIKEWEPVGWVATGQPKYTKWRYLKSFPSEVYLEQFLIRLQGVASANATITVKNFDNPTEQVSTSQTLEAGLNRVILPKRLRAAVFDMTVEVGTVLGTADYKLQIAGSVRALERLKGGIQR